MVGAPFPAAPRFCLFRSHHRPSSNWGPSASTLKSPAHRPALERAARKTNRPHISLWRVPAARRAMPRRHQPRPTHRGCPARRRGLGHSNGRRDTGVASTRSPVAPHTASPERAPAARTYMWGRVRDASIRVSRRVGRCRAARIAHEHAGSQTCVHQPSGIKRQKYAANTQQYFIVSRDSQVSDSVRSRGALGTCDTRLARHTRGAKRAILFLISY